MIHIEQGLLGNLIFFILCLVGSCDMYTWGDGSRSMLGHGEEIEEHRPRVVDALATLSIKMVSCGAYHTLCVTGEQPASFICITSNPSSLFCGLKIRRKVEVLLSVYYQTGTIYLVKLFTFSSVSGETLSWGAGSKGQLGQGHLRDRFTPLKIEGLCNEVVVHVSCNEYHSVAVTGKLVFATFFA